jgi:uncharacterized protein
LGLGILSLEFLSLIFAFLAALAAGFVNAVAGGGTLISFPVLLALGLPPIIANVTNTLGLLPGYMGGVFAQRHHFASQKKRLWEILPVGILGGIVGGLLLLNNSERSFRSLIPFLILLAAVLLALQNTIKKLLEKHATKPNIKRTGKFWAFFFIFLAAIYGGYFGAGLGVMLMAILGLAMNETLTKLNVLKLAISFAINISAAIYFLFSAHIDWLFVLIMMIGAVCGGWLGGKFANRIKPEILRWVIVIIGIVVAVVYFVK